MDLSVQIREKFGTSASKILRDGGLVPAEFYGHGIKNEHFLVSEKDFTKAFKEAGTSTILYLHLSKDLSASNEAVADKHADVKEKKPAIIHDVVHDSLTGRIIHVDFYAVKMDEVITARIPLEFINESPAVKEKGAIINKSMTEIEVESLPQNLPHAFKIDISLLDDINKSICVRDIKVPNGVKILIEGDTVIATATPPLVEEKKEETQLTDVSAVKVEGEEKRAEREAGKTENED